VKAVAMSRKLAAVMAGRRPDGMVSAIWAMAAAESAAKKYSAASRTFPVP
jgi:hypothetical protein